jgi:hypothetical protein
MTTTCGHGGYPPLPICHTSAPAPHAPGTAFTGPTDLTGATFILGGLLLLAALSFALRHLFSGQGDL